MVERGRHSQLRRDQRFCPFCQGRDYLIVETKHHAYNCCPDHVDVRDAALKELCDVDPSLLRGSELCLFARLLNPKKEWEACVGRFFQGVLEKVDARYLVRENLEGDGGRGER